LVRIATRTASPTATAHLFHSLGIRTQAALRHFLRLHSFHLQVHPESPSKVTIFRLRHVSVYGDLEATSEGLARICESSRESLREITLNNCGSWSERLTCAVGRCEGLKVLNLAYSHIKDQDVEMLGRTLGRLERLIVRQVRGLSAASSTTIGTIASLRELDITGVEELPLGPLCCLQLSCLLVDNRSLTAADLYSIVQMDSLQVVSVRKCTGLTPLWHTRISALPHLTSFITI